MEEERRMAHQKSYSSKATRAGFCVPELVKALVTIWQNGLRKICHHPYSWILPSQASGLFPFSSNNASISTHSTAMILFQYNTNCYECLRQCLSSSEGARKPLTAAQQPLTLSGSSDVFSLMHPWHRTQPAADLHKTESSSVQESWPGISDTSESCWETEWCAGWWVTSYEPPAPSRL